MNIEAVVVSSIIIFFCLCLVIVFGKIVDLLEKLDKLERDGVPSNKKEIAEIRTVENNNSDFFAERLKLLEKRNLETVDKFDIFYNLYEQLRTQIDELKANSVKPSKRGK